MKCEICGKDKKAIVLLVNTVYDCVDCSSVPKKNVLVYGPPGAGTADRFKTLDQLAYEMKGVYPFKVITMGKRTLLIKGFDKTKNCFHASSGISSFENRKPNNPIYKLI